MDFSSLISKEIDNKRRKIDDKRKLEKKSGDRQVDSDTLHLKRTGDECNDAKVTADTDGAPNELKYDRPEVDNDTHGKQDTIATGIEDDESKLLESTSDDQLDKMLLAMGEENLSGSKIEKFLRLDLIRKLHQKKERYRIQLEKEDLVDKSISTSDIGNDIHDHKLYLQIRSYLKYLILEWDSSVHDDKESDLLLEVKKDLVTLLYKLRSHKLSKELLISLSTIVYYLQMHDYNKANESYLKLSIGNAAWPIGVQNVGIHSRSASLRTKGVDKPSNIMIDDKTRRWITAIKRLISFCERKWPS